MSAVKEPTPKDSYQYEHSKGRLFRGSSFKYESKGLKDSSLTPSNTRYAHHPKRELAGEASLQERRQSKKESALMDLIGQNLRKSETARKDKEDDFFEYIMRFSYRTKKGYIPTNSGKVNQDSFIICPNIGGKTWQHFFSVCDGHGPLGHHVSSYIKNNLPNSVAGLKTLERHPR